MSDTKQAERYPLTRTIDKQVVEIIAYPNEVTVVPRDDDFVLTPEEAEEFASLILAAANEARKVEWDEESQDGLGVREKVAA